MPIFLFLFIVVPIAEVYLLWILWDNIGFPQTLAIVIITGAIGSYLARMQGINTLRLIQQDLAEGKMPGDRIFSGLLILVGGVLLITPGIMTDIVGLLLMVPGNRRVIIKFLKRKFQDRMDSGQGGNMFFFHMPPGQGPHDIDGM